MWHRATNNLNLNLMERYNEQGELIVKSYFVNEENFIPRGEYKKTELDQRKRDADILLQSIDGNYYTLKVREGITVNGRGVKRYSNGVIAVTERVYERLKSTYKVECDF